MKDIIRKLTVFGSFVAVLTVFGVLSYRVSQRELRQLSHVLVADDGCVARAFFSPEDDLRTLLVSLIDAEQKQIGFAIYMITDKTIAEALVRAAKRGIHVEGVVDRSYGHSRYSKVCVLANAQIPIYVYQTAADERQAGLMHNKFILFAESIEQKALLWTGSYNFTKRASEKNEENALILDNKALIATYEKYYEGLKKRSLQISGTIQCQTQADGQAESSWLKKLGTLF